MKVLNVILIIIVVPVLFLTIILAHEARTISHGKNQNQNMMNNYKEQLIGVIQQGQAPLCVPNPSSMMRQKALFVNHTIDVSFSLRRLLGRGNVTPSGPNPPTNIPPKTSHITTPFLGSIEKSPPSSSMPKGSVSIPQVKANNSN